MAHFNYIYHQLFNPLLRAMNNLGDSASIPEMENEVATILHLTDEQINEIHRDNRTRFSYRLAWARSYLKKYGLLDNSDRGIWVLTDKGKQIKQVNPKDVIRYWHEEKSTVKGNKEEPNLDTEEPEELVDNKWQDTLISIVQNISPQSFEKLCQRLLRELGFINVEVTGRCGDGGIDGKGILRLGGLVSFNVFFQAKRYSGTVQPSVVRDFRGAIQGRADKGLVITTGTFTKAAKDEAQRDGAITIDLIDGLQLAEKLKELRLGISVRSIEEVTINKDWYTGI
jgi:restriction system protein